jgi:hypothetical protein
VAVSVLGESGAGAGFAAAGPMAEAGDLRDGLFVAPGGAAQTNPTAANIKTENEVSRSLLFRR